MHSSLFTLHLNTPRASLRDRISKTQFARGSTEAACQFFMGPWQKSDAPALQAALSGSVTRRTPPAFATCISSCEGCRAVALTCVGGLSSARLRLGRPFHCGENEIQASLISSASVGATPTPATSLRSKQIARARLPRRSEAKAGLTPVRSCGFELRRGKPIWEVFRLLVCKISVKNNCRK
jgi:hypothetical protein